MGTRRVLRRCGGAKRDRTADLLHAMQALSQLSYSPTANCGLYVLGHALANVTARSAPQWRLAHRRSVACVSAIIGGPSRYATASSTDTVRDLACQQGDPYHGRR